MGHYQVSIPFLFLGWSSPEKLFSLIWMIEVNLGYYEVRGRSHATLFTFGLHLEVGLS